MSDIVLDKPAVEPIYIKSGVPKWAKDVVKYRNNCPAKTEFDSILKILQKSNIHHIVSDSSSIQAFNNGVKCVEFVFDQNGKLLEVGP